MGCTSSNQTAENFMVEQKPVMNGSEEPQDGGETHYSPASECTGFSIAKNPIVQRRAQKLSKQRLNKARNQEIFVFY